MIEQILWRRTTLLLRGPGEKDPVPRLVRGKREIPFFLGPDGTGGRVYMLRISNIHGSFLPEGTWKLETGSPVPADLLLGLDSLSRVFRYENSFAYTVTFHYREVEERLYVKTEFVKHNKHPERRSFKKQLVHRALQSLYNVLRIVSVRKDHVLFLSETRSGLSDNMKAVLERLKERKLVKGSRILLHLQDEFGGKASAISRLRMVRRLASSRIIFIDDYIPLLSFITLPKDVQLVQLWHAGFGYKLVGYARFGIEGSPHPYRSCHRQYTRAVIGNPDLADVYAEVFGVDPSVLLPAGMPRLDHFLDGPVMEAARNRIYEKHPELKGRRVILFAPTYRGYNQKEAHYEFQRIDQEALFAMARETGSVVVFKWHHFIRRRIDIPSEYASCLVDLTDENLNDLMYVSDCLITDYSSCFYDYLLLQRPVLFYIYDEKEYAATRGVHYPMGDTAPGLICRTFPEVVEALRQKDIPRVEPLPYMVDQCLTNGSRTASDRILDELFPEREGK